MAVQSLVPHVKLRQIDATRHPKETQMKFTKKMEDDMDISDSDDEDSKEINVTAYQHSENAGLLHLVHGWIQQGQPKGVCGFFLF
jgi:hypothetical protein